MQLPILNLRFTNCFRWLIIATKPLISFQFYLCSQYLNKYTYASGALREFSVSADWVSSLYKSFHTTIKPIISRIIVIYSHLTFNAIVILFICTKTELCKRLIPNNYTLCRCVPIYLSTK